MVTDAMVNMVDMDAIVQDTEVMENTEVMEAMVHMALTVIIQIVTMVTRMTHLLNAKAFNRCSIYIKL